MPLLEVKQLTRYFPVQKSFLEAVLSKKREFVHAVDGIDFSVSHGETFGLVGESGSGKTTTGRLSVRLDVPSSGDILFDGESLSQISSQNLMKFRRRAQMIFQDPTAALNPGMRVEQAIRHGLDIQEIGSEQERKQGVARILERVGLTPPELFYDKFPHQLSGGQRQRVVIARNDTKPRVRCS